MLALLRHLRTQILYQLVRLDVAAADRAEAVGDAVRSGKRLARADVRLKKVCGLSVWPPEREAHDDAGRRRST